jgi:integrase
MKGTPLEDIADLLGHKSLAMARRYAHLSPNKMRAVVSLLKPSDTTSDTSEKDVSGGVSQVVVQ